MVLLEHLGYSFYTRKDGRRKYGQSKQRSHFTFVIFSARFPVFSTHGFSNEYVEMRPAFFAVGPAFKRNLTIDWEIENVDLYNLMATVLQVRPAPNDGNFTRVHRLLSSTVSGPEAPTSGSSLRAIRTISAKVQILFEFLIAVVLVSWCPV